MRKVYLTLLFCLAIHFLANAQPKVSCKPYFQLGGMYFSSKQITSTGVGPGIGFSLGIEKHILVNTDVNLFWLNGNAASVRLAVGYKRNGFWAPAGYVGLSSVFGDRTEILLEDGSRPVSPVISFGFRLAPLRFENEKGFVSALEASYEFGNYQGKNLQLSMLALGIKF